MKKTMEEYDIKAVGFEKNFQDVHSLHHLPSPYEPECVTDKRIAEIPAMNVSGRRKIGYCPITVFPVFPNKG
jgi:hypothetical protein